MKKIIKKMDSYSEAITQSTLLEILSETYKFKLNSLIVDSRDDESVSEAIEKYDLAIIDKGIYLITEVEDLDLLTNAIQKDMENIKKDLIKKQENKKYKRNIREVI